MAYVTLELVKQHLRIDEAVTSEDAILSVYIAAAEDFVEKYTGRKLFEFDELPGMIVQAILLEVGTLYAVREGENTGGQTYVSEAICSMLRPYRVLVADETIKFLTGEDGTKYIVSDNAQHLYNQEKS